jgi:hypothetical protein
MGSFTAAFYVAMMIFVIISASADLLCARRLMEAHRGKLIV